MDTPADPLMPEAPNRLRARGGRRRIIPAYKLRASYRDLAREHEEEEWSNPPTVEIVDGELPADDEEDEEADTSSAAQEQRPVNHVRGLMEGLAQGKLRDLRLRETALPYMATCLPAMASSIMAPYWLAWAMSWMSMMALYRVAQTLDEVAFATGRKRGLFLYGMLANVLLAVWSSLLALAGRADFVPAAAFGHTVLLYLAIAPACRVTRSRMTRRIPLRWTFPVLAAIVVAAEGVMVLEDFGWLGP